MKKKKFTNCFGIEMTKEEDDGLDVGPGKKYSSLADKVDKQFLNPMTHVFKWLEDNKNKYPPLHILREYKHETLLNYWFMCWGNRDPQEYQDMEWDWQVEIEKFLEDPAFQTQLAIKENPDICGCCGKQKEEYIEALRKDIEDEKKIKNKNKRKFDS